MTNILDILACPLCSGKLSCDGGSLKCALGHTFDISKSGYVNLLPPGKGKNSHTGDERDMVKARANFLSRGYYDRLDTRSAEIISDMPQDEMTLVDMGAGEGRHTLKTTSELISRGKKMLSVGFDASKYASECGMKKSRVAGLSEKKPYDMTSRASLVFIPANIFSLPIVNDCADVCLSMFAPIPWDEAYRVLKKSHDSMLLVLSSGKNHLIELRSLIYDSVNISDSLPEIPEGNDSFVSAGTTELCYTAHLENSEDIKNLFTMTPFYYKTTEEGKKRLYSQNELDVTVDVNYTIFKLK